MLLLHHLPHGAGMPLLSPFGGQDYFGEQVANGEKHLRACGQLRGQLCLLMQQVADLLPATSRGAWPPGAQVGASCVCQHAVHAMHTPEGTGVPYSRPSEERVPVSPLVTEQH